MFSQYLWLFVILTFCILYISSKILNIWNFNWCWNITIDMTLARFLQHIKVIELEDASFCNFFDSLKTLKGMDSILDTNTTLTFWHIHSIVHIEHLLFSIRSLNTSNLLVRISMRQDFPFHTKTENFQLQGWISKANLLYTPKWFRMFCFFYFILP